MVLIRVADADLVEIQVAVLKGIVDASNFDIICVDGVIGDHIVVDLCLSIIFIYDSKRI